MNSPEHNERSDKSKPGTSGLHASNLEEKRKSQKSCSTDAHLEQQENDRERKRSNDEEIEPGNHRTEKLGKSDSYLASGLKPYLHGVAYQLKLLMLFLKRGIDQGYPFRLATEMDAAEKFDDLVFQYSDGEKIVHRFLQAKHKRDKFEEISIDDLLTITKKNLNLKKYFESYRKITKNPEFNGRDNEIKDLIICTNIGFKWDDKRGALTLRKNIFHKEKDETIFRADLLRFQEKFTGREVIVSALDSVDSDNADLIRLAREIAGRASDDECTKKGGADYEEETSDAFLESYRVPLEKEVFDGDRKKLRPEFVECAGSLSRDAISLRQAIEKVFHDPSRTDNSRTDPVIEDFDKFVKVVAAALIQGSKDSKIIKINKSNNVILENFDKLAWYVLVKKAGKIGFSVAFLNESKLPGNLGHFRKKLLAELSEKNITREDIAEYTFEVYEDFQTCDELYSGMNTFWKLIGEREFDLFDNFITRDANLESVDVFVENLADLIRKSRNNKEPNVEIKKENNKIYKNMIELAKYAKMIEENDVIRFRPEFLVDTRLPDNLNKFRDGLKAKVEDLDKLRFVINNFRKTKLPKKEVDSFLDKLVFAVNQPNETELGKTIDNEMGEYRGINLIDSSSIASKFQSYVFNWMKDKEGRFLTRADGERFFGHMKKNLTSLQLTWHTQELSERMQQINIRFTKDEMELQEFLEPKNETQLFILSMPHTILGLIQVHQILKEKPHYQKDDSYIFLGLNSFLLMQGPVVDAFASQSEHLLIIECKSIEVNERVSYTESLKAMKSDNTGKIILITEKAEKDGTPVDQFKEIFEDRFVEKKVEVVSLLDLENESRETVIKGKNVKFQGKEVPLSALVTDEESMNLINAEALAKLINNKTLEIGKCLEDLGDVNNYYISRTLQRPKINQSLMKDGSRFYLATDNQLKGFDSQQNQDIVVISDNDELFKKLSDEEKYEEHNIHWLKSEESHFICQESKGTLTNLRGFVDRDSVESFSPEKVADISNKITIIAAEPGMGKSTMLTHLSVKTKESEPTVWVAKVNLCVDCSKKLEAMDDTIIFDDKKTIDFLFSSAELTSEMPEYRFVKNCYKTGNMILLFDGFDEISPYYEKKVIELLKFLKGTKVKKIWVTTRPYDIKNKLEDELGSFSYVLQEFDKGDQKQFLMDFWKAKLEFDELNDERAKTSINALLKRFSECIKDCQRKFIGIPLQIKMIAVVFKETFQKCLESDEEDIDGLEEKIKENLELLSLYNSFFEIKFKDIFFGEKQPKLDTATPVFRDIMDIVRKHVVKVHEILALKYLYPNDSIFWIEKVTRSLQKFKLSINKIGIIDRVVDNNPVFVHQSFAEYFVALWFSKNWQEKKVKEFLKEHIFNEESIVIRNFFDRMLANNELQSSESQGFSTEHPASANVYTLHNAVLNNDESGVQKLLNDDESPFDKTDAAGRNLLHLAAARGHEGIVQSFLEALKKRADHNDNTYQLRKEDKLFDWTPLTYAGKCDHWNVAELFLQTGYAGEDMFKDMKNIEKRKTRRNEETLLHKAAREGYLKILELLLKKGVKIDVRDSWKNTPLHLAAGAGHLEIVRSLISQQDANSDVVNKFGHTVLHTAAESGNLKLVKYLVDEEHADFEAADELGYTVLHTAVESGKPELVKYLVGKKNANFDAVDEEQRTALHIAALKGNLEIVKYLVDQKNADFEAVDSSGRTALHHAATKGKLEIIKYLVKEKNANVEAVDYSGGTALHIAASHGHLEVVKYLAGEKNANVEAVDKSGYTALYRAIQNKDFKMVKYLVDEKNVNLDAVHESRRTALHIVVESSNLEVLKYLFDKRKPNVEAVDKEGRTALHIAAQRRDPLYPKTINDTMLRLVEYLVGEKNANFEAVDNGGRTALHMATKNRNLRLVEYLVGEKNANVEAVDKEGRTALHIAAQIGDPFYPKTMKDIMLGLVKYLVGEKNAKFEAVDNEGRTALHMATKNGNLRLVKYFVGDKNANFEVADKSGRTALHYAVEKRNWGIIKYLVDEKNANFEAVDNEGRTALHMATKSGNLGLVEYLVDEKNANFEVADKSGRTALYYAVEKQDWGIIKYLVDEKNVNLDAVHESGRTALHVVAESGNLEVLKYLFDKRNPNVEAVDNEGRTALHMATKNGNLRLVEYLVGEKNANFEAVDKEGRTALHIAAQIEDPFYPKTMKDIMLGLVKYLVGEKNANFEAVDNEGRTALHIAAQRGDLFNFETMLRLVKYLVGEKNANFEAVDNEGRTVLHMATKSGNLRLVEYLVGEKNANFEAVDNGGRTALHMATKNRNLRLVEYLVGEKNANVEAVDKEGSTVLHIAAQIEDPFYPKTMKDIMLGLVKYLVGEKNAKFEAVDNEGRTALHMATKNGNLRLVKYFVGDKNANFEAVDNEGRTVLHMATKSGNLRLVEYLVGEKNANFEAVDKSGHTALHYAVEKQYCGIIKYLKKVKR